MNFMKKMLVPLLAIAGFGLILAANGASAATLSLTAPVAAHLITGQSQIVRWSSSAYSAPTVSINLIKKVGSNPNRYELVRTVSTATKNDGIGYWVPAVSDAGSSLSIEVGCVNSKVACTASKALSQIAVTNSSRFANTASAFRALEAASNR